MERETIVDFPEGMGTITWAFKYFYVFYYYEIAYINSLVYILWHNKLNLPYVASLSSFQPIFYITL